MPVAPSDINSEVARYRHRAAGSGATAPKGSSDRTTNQVVRRADRCEVHNAVPPAGLEPATHGLGICGLTRDQAHSHQRLRRLTCDYSYTILYHWVPPASPMCRISGYRLGTDRQENFRLAPSGDEKALGHWWLSCSGPDTEVTASDQIPSDALQALRRCSREVAPRSPVRDARHPCAVTLRCPYQHGDPGRSWGDRPWDCLSDRHPPFRNGEAENQRSEPQSSSAKTAFGNSNWGRTLGSVSGAGM